MNTQKQITSNYVGQLLQKTFTISNNQERKLVESEIKQLSIAQTNFMQILGQIILSDEFEEQIKKAACTYISTFIRDCLNQSEYPITQKKQQLQCLTQLLAAPQIKMGLKRQLADPLSIILDLDFDTSLRTYLVSFVGQTLEALSQACRQMQIQIAAAVSTITQMPTAGLEGALFMMQSCLQSSVYEPTQHGILYQATVPVLNVIMKHLLIDQVAPALQNLQAIAITPNFSQSAQYTATKQLLEIVGLYAQTIKIFVVKLDNLKQRPEMGSYVAIRDVTLQPILMALLSLFVPTVQQLPNCVVCTSRADALDEIINEAKAKVLRTYTILVEAIFNSPAHDSVELEQSAFFLQTRTVLTILMQSLLQINSASTEQHTNGLSLEKLLQCKASEHAIVEVLNFLTACTSQNAYYDVFQHELAQQKFLANAIYNLIKCTPPEYEMLQSNPQEFVSLALDTVDKQTTNCAKTAAAKFIENVCDHIDCALTQTTIECVFFIDNSIQQQRKASYQGQAQSQVCVSMQFQQFYAGLETTNFNLQTTADLKIDASLHVLTVLSYLLPKRQQGGAAMNIFSLFEDSLKANADYLVMNPHLEPLLKSRVCLMVGYYYDNLFQDPADSQYFNAYLIFTVQCLSIADPLQQAVSIEAIDTLNNIFQDDEISDYLSPLIQDIFSVVVPLILTCTHKAYFEMLQEALHCQSFSLAKQEQQVKQCVDLLTKRIKIEYDRIANEQAQCLTAQQKHQCQTVANKCFNIIRQISMEGDFIPKYVPHFETALLPLFRTLATPDRIDFSDDLLCILTNFIIESKGVTSIQREVYLLFPTVLMHQNGVLGSMLNTINLYLQYDSEYMIQSSNNLVQITMGMGVTAMFSDHLSADNATRADGALLLQLVIQYLGKGLTDHNYQYIFDHTLKRLQTDIQNMKAFFVARLLGVFYCSFIENFVATQQILQAHNQLDNVFSLMVKKWGDNQHPYEKKLFVICMASIMGQTAPMDQVIAAKMVDVLKAVISVLKVQQIVEDRAAKNKPDISSVKDENDVDYQVMAYLKGCDLTQQNDQFFAKDVNSESELDSDLGFDSDDEQDYLEVLHPSRHGEKYESKMVIDRLISRYKQQDEFAYFHNVCIQLKNKDQQGMHSFIYKLEPKMQDYFHEVLSSARFTTQGGQQTTVRKIVKVKRNK